MMFLFIIVIKFRKFHTDRTDRTDIRQSIFFPYSYTRRRN